MTNAIGLICIRPNEVWCDFLNKFTSYTLHIIIDDESFDCEDFIQKYKNITFVKIDNSKCREAGVLNMNLHFSKKDCTAWEKAVYYFSYENNNYDFVWLLEDDVFIPGENSILNIDKQFINHDLLSNKCETNSAGKKDYWYNWQFIKMTYSLPHYRGMMCAIRMSKKMLNSIANYAKKNKTLFFLEAMFPTIAMKNNLQLGFPKELETIHFRHDFKKKDINKASLYHPVKNLQQHIFFRDP